MEDRDHHTLHRNIEIDEEVAAADKIKTGEWRIFRQVVIRKDAGLSERLLHPIIPIKLIEELCPPLLRKHENFRLRIDTFTGLGKGRFADIACKYLDWIGDTLFLHGFKKTD